MLSSLGIKISWRNIELIWSEVYSVAFIFNSCSCCCLTEDDILPVTDTYQTNPLKMNLAEHSTPIGFGSTKSLEGKQEFCSSLPMSIFIIHDTVVYQRDGVSCKPTNARLRQSSVKSFIQMSQV